MNSDDRLSGSHAVAQSSERSLYKTKCQMPPASAFRLLARNSALMALGTPPPGAVVQAAAAEGS